MPVKKSQVLQHIRICGVALLQRNRLPLFPLGSGRLGQRIYLCPPHQLQIGLFIADPFKSCIQAHAVAVGPAKVTAVLICVGIEAQMVFSQSVVMAEGAACLDLRSPQRSGVEDKPTPSGRFHDRDLIILSDGQTGSPPIRRHAAPRKQ